MFKSFSKPGRVANSHIRNYWMLYAMAIPGLIWLILFRYIPILGSVIAFQDYKIFKGIAGSSWIGLDNFKYLFSYPDFFLLFRNTLVLAFYTVFITFPVPIILALLLNEIQILSIKKTVQTVIYLPHFFSWVIIAGLAFQFLGLHGPFNSLIKFLGGEPQLWMQKDIYFRFIVTISSVYKESGWGTIVYLAAITGISPELYEAAMIDGANRFRRILYITIPCIIPTAITLLLLRIGNFMNLGFDRIYNFLTPLTTSVGDIFDTYVYRVGITEGRYSLTTAIGLFQSFIGLLLIGVFNRLSKKVSEGLW